MYRIFFVLLTAIVIVAAIIRISIPASEEVSAEENLPVVFGTEVLFNVFDDGVSTVYIRIPYREVLQQFGGNKKFEQSINYVHQKKREWELRFPNKKIVFGTFAVGGGMNETVLYGLFMHYEFSDGKVGVRPGEDLKKKQRSLITDEREEK